MDKKQIKFFDRVASLLAHVGGANPTEVETALKKAVAFVRSRGESWQSWTGIAEVIRQGARQGPLPRDRVTGGASAGELREARQQLALAQEQVRRLRREKAEQSRLSDLALGPLQKENTRLKAALANATEANELRPFAQEMEVITVKGERDDLRAKLDGLRAELAAAKAAKARPRHGDVPELLRRAHADPAFATLSVREAARRLGVSPQTIFSHRHKHNSGADVG
jgi:hypothetical protein